MFSRDMLLECVRGGETDAFDRAVDTHISNLRRKIGDDPKAPTFIRTVWGVGYRFHLS
ncbi:winged helix-turn-helix domain-containing protein [Nitrospirillum viridazoti]|uniref:winged helix-turn-helix domain-containing protein n=1 Tax=Nitrospirillum viridazoti TaxID=3144925 RepID=UPI000307C676|nr:helix-turn-helix domain-containing protein [Nitrospirillum amazonense]